jgi:transcriptional regulator with AAA-type ATPase domain/transcriptional regulatory protein LevR
MRRIELIHTKLKELYKGEGISALELANSLGLSRANVSSDLNKLCEKGLLRKEKKKVVLFYPNDKKNKDIFQLFLEKNESLEISIEKAKSAIMYPPNGMHMLILGETGVGKSKFANIISEYAMEIGMMSKDAPFIVFNCADYANNPQLLLAQLFGSKKGSYTGAVNDRVGLIELANNGILFLDEVHRLPPEGQEMFFTFMDKGLFRRLGETDVERTANVLIISATTENTDSSLLQTFTRRIPMVINIPALRERRIDERFNLITSFFEEESSVLNKEILVSINVVKGFLGYKCPNNIGQLKTDIKLVCAKAYLEYVSGKKDEISISSKDLPEDIRQGIYLDNIDKKTWYRNIDIRSKHIIFNSTGHKIMHENDFTGSVYEMLENNIFKLKNEGLNTDELIFRMELDIENYFDKYIEGINERFNISNLESIIDIKTINTISSIVKYSEEKLGISISEKIYYGLAVHIDNAIKRIKNNEKIVNLNINEIRSNNKKEFNVALKCIDIIENHHNIEVPIDEVAFITVFLAYNENKCEKSNYVQVFVIAHGNSTASSMVDTAHKLLGIEYARALNAPIDEKPHDTINRLKNTLKSDNNKNEIIFLVDMGSLLRVGDEVEKELNIKCKTIHLVSTLHVIEATRKASMGATLEEIYLSTMAVNSLMENNINKTIESTTNNYKANKKLAMITACSTGKGGAVVIKEILERKLNLDDIHIMPIGIFNEKDIIKNIKDIENNYRVICIISSFDINIDIPQFSLNEIIKSDKLEKIEELIEVEKTYLKLCETLKLQLKQVDAKSVVDDIKEFSENTQNNLNYRISINILIGITFHISMLIDKRNNINYTKVENQDDINYINKNRHLYKVIEVELQKLFSKYNLKTTQKEILYIMKSFDKNISNKN